jgi:hypothetical protein
VEGQGDKYISETPRENIEKMEQYVEKAKLELNASLKLTPKPFLSIFHLIDISGLEGDRKSSSTLLEYANKVLPGNTLARGRYMHYLTPRWGGSYEQMQSFIAQSRREGVDSAGIMQLEAIMYDDMGFSAHERNDRAAAIEYFAKALELGQRIGGEFRKDFLTYSDHYSCREPELNKYCKKK